MQHVFLQSDASVSMQSYVHVLEEFISKFTHFDTTQCRACLSTIEGTRIVICLACGPDSIARKHLKRSRESLFPFDKCRTTYIDPVSMHEHEVQHKGKLNELARDLRSVGRVLVRYVRLCSKYREVFAAKQIANLEWRDLVQASLFRYLVAPMQSLQVDAPLEEELLAEALKAIKSYEYWENSALLGCAVWKAQCLQQMPNGNYLDSRDWLNNRWKTCQSEQQNCAATSTIVSTVRPFLDPLSASDCRSVRSSTGSSSAPEASHGSLRLRCSLQLLSGVLTCRTADKRLARSMHFRYDDSLSSPPTVQCELCNVTAPKWHYFDDGHQERERRLLCDLQQMIVVTKRITVVFTQSTHSELDLLDQIAKAPWRNSVQAKLSRYLFAPSSDVNADNELLHQTLLNLKRCEYWERLVLVGLAVWKSQCLWQMPVSCNYLASEQWIASDWKTCKAAQRDSHAVNVIVQCVRPFLDPMPTKAE
jgi:hypothetical protein